MNKNIDFYNYSGSFAWTKLWVFTKIRIPFLFKNKNFIRIKIFFMKNKREFYSLCRLIHRELDKQIKE